MFLNGNVSFVMEMWVFKQQSLIECAAEVERHQKIDVLLTGKEDSGAGVQAAHAPR